MPFPTLQGESIEVSLQFALLLRDGFANSDQLVGDVSVLAGPIEGQQKDSSGNFLFNNLKPGPQSFVVSSGLYTPYYQPTKIPINIPMPSALWPAFPDMTIANPN